MTEEEKIETLQKAIKDIVKEVNSSENIFAVRAIVDAHMIVLKNAGIEIH